MRHRPSSLVAPAFALLGLVGCGVGLDAVPAGNPPTHPEDSGRVDTGGRDTGGRDTGGRDTGQADSGHDSGDSGQDSGGGPRAPVRGDLVLSELMVNPAAVADEAGEWLELVNLSDHTLDLTDLQLTDDDVDLVTIDGAPTVPAGGFVLLCSNGDRATNGGVTCTSTYRYGTTGGDFALANTEDEVNVLGADGAVLDSFRYTDGFAPSGASTGVAPASLTPSGNDAAGAWCTQRGALAGGDQGTPGSRNSGC